MTEPEPIELQITFAPRGANALLSWRAEVLGVRTSLLVAPIPTASLAVALRALDVIQDPAYPHAWNDVQGRHFTFSENEQAQLVALDLWDSAAARVRRDAHRQLGRRIYRALVADESGARALATARDHATALGRPLALELQFPPGAAHIAALPWELLWDEGNTPLIFTRGDSSWVVRRLDLAQAVPPTRLGTGPLKILAISPQEGIGEELRQVERAARAAALGPLLAAGRAELREVEPATRAALVEAIEADDPPDIVHFYGHGRLRDGVGELLLDAAPGGTWLPAPALAALFGGVGLVALHACQGAAVSPGSQGEPLLGGVAQALCAAGVPAVLGMQLSVRADAATRTAAAVYGALAAGRSLQSGVAQARRALFVEEPNQTSWFVPTLYLRGRWSGPFHLRQPIRPAAASATGTPQQLQSTQTVVARGGATIRALRIQGRPGAAQRVIALDGASISDVSIRTSS